MPSTLEPMYTVDTLAATWGVVPKTVRRWIAEGKLRAVKPDRLLLIPQSAVDEFISRNTVNGVIVDDGPDEEYPRAAGE